MKKALFLLAIILVTFFKQDIYWALRPLPDFSNPENKVVLYSAKWCGYCDRARSLLTRAKVSFHEYDIESSEKHYRAFEALGGRGVPLLLVNGKIISGWAPEKIIENLVE